MEMALHAGSATAQGAALLGKRKQLDEAIVSRVNKKPRSDNNPSIPQTSSNSLQPLNSFITDLQSTYEVKTLSVLSSTSIAKRVDTILEHLSRFHPWDPTVLPGVVLLYARSSTTNKLITIAETVRRRIHEADQKWYQYNRLYEMEWATKQIGASPSHDDSSVIEDTVIGDEGEDDGDDGYFETMNVGAVAPTQFERAVHGEPRARQVAHMSIFLSRLPVPELRARDNFTVQSNEEHIDYIRKKRAGLA